MDPRFFGVFVMTAKSISSFVTRYHKRSRTVSLVLKFTHALSRISSLDAGTMNFHNEFDSIECKDYSLNNYQSRRCTLNIIDYINIPKLMEAMEC